MGANRRPWHVILKLSRLSQKGGLQSRSKLSPSLERQCIWTESHETGRPSASLAVNRLGCCRAARPGHGLPPGGVLIFCIRGTPLRVTNAEDNCKVTSRNTAMQVLSFHHFHHQHHYYRNTATAIATTLDTINVGRNSEIKRVGISVKTKLYFLLKKKRAKSSFTHNC